jgi:hypothetical protein
MVQAVRRSVHIIGSLQTCSKTNGDCANFYCHIGQVDLRSDCCCPTSYHDGASSVKESETEDDKMMMIQFHSFSFKCRVNSYKANYSHRTGISISIWNIRGKKNDKNRQTQISAG